MMFDVIAIPGVIWRKRCSAKCEISFLGGDVCLDE
jgi:hypothetical protein